ncbi:hypothetical protein A2G96_12815 [Cupriavidus nantongensis]|uniref:Uncharacterized protein n=1 Tax=Cupriavidus nantongensis TaxID=1796606 RepID=A0A142JKD8_9BURK|nr:hypothetical protein A2G96_12815 [Cupriavidus nantongensis]
MPEAGHAEPAINFDGLVSALHARLRHGGTVDEIAEPALLACRRLARAGQVQWLAAALRVSGQVSDLAQSVARERLPRLIINEYLIGRLGLDPTLVMRWEAAHGGALALIAERALDPTGLPMAIQAVESSIAAFARTT